MSAQITTRVDNECVYVDGRYVGWLRQVSEFWMWHTSSSALASGEEPTRAAAVRALVRTVREARKR